MTTLKAPFPYFGGKSTMAKVVWDRFGSVRNYVEPFCGSAAMLLARPDYDHQIETINDMDGFVCNFYRALQAAPDDVAHHANWQVNEADLHARNYWLIVRRESLTDRLMGDPDYYDAKIAGWWVWGACSSIGASWCNTRGPWLSVDGIFTKGDPKTGIVRGLPHLGPNRGIHRRTKMTGLESVKHWLDPIAERMRKVRVACGDWSRVCGPTITYNNAITAVFLDPPYATEGRDDVYVNESYTVAHDVRTWCIENGDNPLLRIALCGYDGEHNELETLGWSVFAWQAQGGFSHLGSGRGGDNAKLERIWFSPHCLDEKQTTLF